MLTTLGWITIAILLALLAFLQTVCQDTKKYKGSCYKPSLYRCLECNNKECYYSKMAEQIDKKVDKR